MNRFFNFIIALLGFGRAAWASDSIAIRNVDDQNRIYQAACDIIEPYMRLADKPPKKVTSEAAVELQRAIQMLDAVTTHAPANWSAFWIKGKACQAIGDSKAACAAFKSAFDLQDKNPDVAREYMYECLKLGDGAEGLRAAQQALAVNPSDAGLHANLALALLIAAKPKEAQVAVDEALKMDPQDKISQRLHQMILKVIDGSRAQPTKLSELER